VRIGIDVTALYIVKAGIFYHSLNLLQHLLSLDCGHEFVLLDYGPIRGDRSLPFDLRSLESERTRVVEITGPHQRRLIEWKRLDFFGGRFTAQRIDALMDRPWDWYINRMTRRELRATLAELDVLHVSEVSEFEATGARLVATVHDLSPILLPKTHTLPNRERFEKRMRYVQRYVDSIIAVSEHTKSDLIDVMDIPEERVHVVYNAAGPVYTMFLDRKRVDQVLRKHSLPDTGYILYVGTLEPRKNLVRLVEAYAVALDRSDSSLPPLVLAGGKGWFYEGILQSVDRLGLQGRVIFTGFVDDEDLPAMFHGAVFFVYPSLYEGFGMPVLEAMACGVPVITSDVSSLPEVVGDAGVLVDPTDTHAIADALIAMNGDAGGRARFRAAGLDRAAQFSWERAARETLAVYEQVGQMPVHR
jgi:glycosyltransferase involved in cell wall biosynthesis